MLHLVAHPVGAALPHRSQLGGHRPPLGDSRARSPSFLFQHPRVPLRGGTTVRGSPPDPMATSGLRKHSATRSGASC